MHVEYRCIHDFYIPDMILRQIAGSRAYLPSTGRASQIEVHAMNCSDTTINQIISAYRNEIENDPMLDRYHMGGC